jgi:hypothetical protein
MIYRSTLESGVVPTDWKTALVTPVFKKGQQYDPGNYRPISLTSVSCKLFEHILVSNIMTHLESNNILHSQQHGFRRGCSCESQLLEFAEQLSDHMERGISTDVVVMDFAKAFDKVNHAAFLYTNWTTTVSEGRSTGGLRTSWGGEPRPSSWKGPVLTWSA